MTYLLIGSIVGVSLLAFREPRIFHRLCFWVEPVLAGDGLRMIGSAFLHADTTHLAFNMLSLYFFGDALEASLHSGQYAAIALGSLVGGNLLALRMHRKDPNYRAVGASGMVSGLIFSAIILYPEIRIGILFLPFMLPGWIYGLLFLGISLFGMKRAVDNIGHEAHLGGALSGLFLTLVLFPDRLSSDNLELMALAVPCIALLALSIFKPALFERIGQRDH